MVGDQLCAFSLPRQKPQLVALPLEPVEEFADHGGRLAEAALPRRGTGSTVDRFLHHAHVVVTDGVDSYRLAQATAGTGVTPLA